MIAADLDKAMKKYADLVDMQGDFQQQIRNMASDSKVFDGFAQGAGVLSDGLSTLASTYGALTGDTQNAVRAMNAARGIQTAFNTAVGLTNALQRQSSLMLAVNEVKTWALTRAKQAEAQATGQATIAQRLYNSVAAANPYTLLISSVLALGTAIVAFAAYQANATKKTKEHEEELKRAKEATDAYANTYKSNFSKSISTLKRLQAEWKSLRTETEKKEWINNNKTEFEGLDLSIKNVYDAEKTFAGHTDAIVESLKKRAKAAAATAQAEVLYGQAIEAQNKADEIRNGWKDKQVKAGDTDFSKPIGSNNAGIVQYGTYDTQSAQKHNAELKAQAEKEAKIYEETYVKTLNDQADKLIGDNVYADTHHKVTSEKKEKKDTDKVDYDKLTLQNKLLYLKQQEAELSDIINGKTEKSVKEQARATQQLNEVIQKQAQVRREMAEQSTNKYDINKQQPFQIKPLDSKSFINVQEVQDAIARINKRLETEQNIYTRALLESQKRQFQETIDKWNLETGVKIIPKVEGLDIKNADPVKIEEEKDKFGKFMSSIEIGGVGDFYENLSNGLDVLRDTQVSAERIGTLFGSLGGAVGDFGDALADLGVDTEGLEAMSQAMAIASLVASAAQAIASAKHWWEWVAAAAAVGTGLITVIGQFKKATGGSSKAKGYANGGMPSLSGMVQSGSLSGDRNLIRVNGNEAILNTRQ